MTTVSPGEISLAVDHMMEGRKIDCYGKANVSEIPVERRSENNLKARVLGEQMD